VTCVLLQANELDMTQTDLARDYVSGCKVSIWSQTAFIFNHLYLKSIMLCQLRCQENAYSSSPEWVMFGKCQCMGTMPQIVMLWCYR